MSYGWAREYGVLPPGRASDDGNGLLVITRVRTEDSGTYICTARVGSFVTTDRAVLTVGGKPKNTTATHDDSVMIC